MSSLAFSYILTGALVIAYSAVGLFFLRFWKDSRDRLFGIFALAFFVLAVQRLALGIMTGGDEDLTILYVIRLLAFLLILWGIIDKNRAAP